MQTRVDVASRLELIHRCGWIQTFEEDLLQYPQKSTEISHQKGLVEEG